MPIKVGVLYPWFIAGGAERWLLSLVRCADPTRIEWVGTALCEWSEEEECMTRELSRFMPIYGTTVPPDSKFHDHRYVQRPGPNASTGIGIIASQADVIIAWTSHSLGHMLNYYRESYGLKVVLVSHGCLAGFDLVNSMSGATHLASVSEPATAAFSRFIDKSKVTIISSGIDLERTASRRGPKITKAELGFDEDDFVVGYVGRMQQELKNPLAAAHAIKALTDYGITTKAKALFVGKSEHHSNTQNIITQLDQLIIDRYRCIDWVDNIGDFLAVMDVFVTCSISEAFCLAMFEAWMAAVPVVSTVVGVVSELEEKHGQLVAQCPINPSPEQVANCVIRTQQPEFAKVVERARNLVWREYTAPAMAERWTLYLEQICKGIEPSVSCQCDIS